MKTWLYSPFSFDPYSDDFSEKTFVELCSEFDRIKTETASLHKIRRQYHCRPAWEKAKPGKNGGGRGSNSTVTNKLRDANDSWGVTTYNLLDLENGVGVDDNRNNDNGNRFGNFRDLTRDRNEEEGERRRQQYNER